MPKIADLTEMTAAQVADDDLLVVVDVSAGTAGTKSVPVSELATKMGVSSGGVGTSTTGQVLTNSSGAVAGRSAPSGSLVGTTDTQIITNKTFPEPRIDSFNSAPHTHTSAAGGGTLTAAAIASGTLGTARLGSGAASAGTYLRGDQAWAVPDGSVSGVFNVMSATYGAVGDGSHDDTSAFQTAAMAAVSAHGKLLIPPPPPGGFYKLTSTILLPTGTPSGQHWLDIDAGGLSYYDIRWRGGNNASVFKMVGWHNAALHNVKVYIDNSQTGVIGFDLDTAAAAGSTGTISFYDCSVNGATGTSNVGWRVGHVSAGGGDLSFINWNNCFFSAEGGSVPANTRGWLIEGANALNLNWFGGGCYYAAKAFTNHSESGATNGTGGGCQYFYGFGTSHCDVDFEQEQNSTMGIFAGRFEHGKRFLNVPSSSGHTVVVVSGAEIDAYNNSSSAVVNFDRPGTLIWDGVRVTGATPATAAFMNLGGFTAIGQLSARAGAFEGSGQFWTNGGGWIEHRENVGLLDGSSQQVGFVPNRAVNAQSASYTAAIKDTNQVVSISNASANTFTLPPNASVPFPLETIIVVYQAGAGQTTVTAGVGVTLRAPSGAATAAQYASAYARKIGTNEWVVSV